MLGLAIHTSSPQLGLMLQSVDSTASSTASGVASEAASGVASEAASEIASETVERHRVWDLGREVSSQLHVKLLEFMVPYCWQHLSFIAVAKGPGGFTGTRIGVVAARTLAQQLDIPLFGISSLAAVAAQSISQAPLAEGQDIAIAMPAKREAVYGAIYRPNANSLQGDLKPVLEEAVLPQADWQKTLAKWDNPVREVTTAVGSGTADSVTGIMTLALARWVMGERSAWPTVMPFYGQHPVHR